MIIVTIVTIVTILTIADGAKGWGGLEMLDATKLVVGQERVFVVFPREA